MPSVSPPAVAALPRTSSAAWRLGLLAGWLCLAPTMSGTVFKDWYAYSLAGVVVLWLISTWNWTDQLLRSWSQFSSIGMILGLGGALLSTAITPLVVTASDQFQLLREFYPVLLIGAWPVLLGGMTAEESQRFLERFAWMFLAGCVVLFALQNASSAFFDFMLRYYYIVNDEAGASGHMRSRPGLTFGNPNNVGLAIAFLGIILITRRGVPAWKLAAAIVLTTLLILCTASRTALFGYAAGLVVVGLVQFGRMMLGAILLWLGFLVLSQVLDLSAFTESANDMVYRFFYDRSSMQEREDIWQRLLVSGDWSEYYLFGFGPAKQREAIFDSGYVLVLYRYGVFGAICTAWWQLSLLGGGLADVLRHDPLQHGLRRASLTACFSCASYAMAPMTDPRLCALFLLLIASTLTPYRMLAVSLPRRAAPARAVYVPTKELRPCAS